MLASYDNNVSSPPSERLDQGRALCFLYLQYVRYEHSPVFSLFFSKKRDMCQPNILAHGTQRDTKYTINI